MRSDIEIENLIKALDAIGHQVLVVSPGLEIVAANAYAHQAHGPAVIGRKCFEVFCGQEHPCDTCDLQAAFSTEVPAGAAGPGLAGKGRHFPCGRIYPIFAEEKLDALVCTDIGPRGGNDSAERLKLANAFLKNLIQSSPDAIIAADPKGNILLFNEAARKLSGYTDPEALHDLKINDVYPEGDIRDMMARLRSEQYGGIGKLKAYHVTILDKQGREIPIRLDAAIVYDGRKEAATIGYFRDLRDGLLSPGRGRRPAAVAPGAVRKAHSLGMTAASVAQHLKLYNQQFSDTAIGVGLIDRAQLEKALEHQRQLEEKTKIDVPLGRILIQLGYITEEQRTAILAMQALAEENRGGGQQDSLGEKARALARELEIYNQRFGDLSLKLGFITGDQLERSLQMQKKIRAKTKIDVPLGRVLEQLHYITEEQRAAVLAVQALAEEDTPGCMAAGTETVVVDTGTAGNGTGAVETESAAAEPEPEPVKSAAETVVPAPDAAETESTVAEPEPESVKSAAETVVPGPDAAETESAAAEPEPEPVRSAAETVVPGPDAAEIESAAAETAPEAAEAGSEEIQAETDTAAAGPDDEPGHPEASTAETPEPESRIRDYFAVAISEDKLTARLLPKAREREKVTFDDLRDLIDAEGIRHGMIAEAEIRHFFESDPEDLESLVIARGYPPGAGKDPEIIYHFETDYLQAGKILEDGTIDWKERGEIPQVEEGALLAEIIPGVYGAVGMDVFGNEIPAEPISKAGLTAGKGVATSDDGNRFTADAKGTPQLAENQTLVVFPVLQIDGDIGIETGHIEFDGHIEVAGTIQSGYQVRGASLRVQSMNAAEIYIRGDISVAGGIFESKIKCQGSIKAGHVHKSDIDAGGDLVVAKEIIESEAEVYGVCQLTYGTIIASKIAARGGISVQNVGTAMSKPSHLDVGVNHKLRREISGFKKLYARAERKKKDISPRINALREESDQINGELGEVAQKQDRVMVQSRQLQEKFKSRDSVDESVKAEYEKAVAELETRRSRMDTLVEDLMQKDGELEKNIGELEEQAAEIDAEQAELEERLAELRERREAEKGKPVVKVSGDLFHGNKITGPKAKITIEEDCRHVTIFETDKSDDGQFVRWHMKITPLR